jgi:hypothetical protein
MRLSQVIRKLPGQMKWRLYSLETGKNLGTYPSKAKALARERQIQFFKKAKR